MTEESWENQEDTSELSVTEESWENQIKAAEEDLAIVNLKKSETIGHKWFRKLVVQFGVSRTIWTIKRSVENTQSVWN